MRYRRIKCGHIIEKDDLGLYDKEGEEEIWKEDFLRNF